MHASRLTPGTRWTFGAGGIAYGVLYNAHYFVLAFYSQVLGLDPGLAGLAVGIGLVVDARRPRGHRSGVKACRRRPR